MTRQYAVTAAAHEAFTRVNLFAEYAPGTFDNLYVYADGLCTYGDPDPTAPPIAQAPITHYASVEALVAALNETLSDEDFSEAPAKEV